MIPTQKSERFKRRLTKPSLSALATDDYGVGSGCPGSFYSGLAQST